MMTGIVTSRYDTTTNRDLMKAGILRKIFDETDTKALTYYKPLVNDLTTKDEWIRDIRIGGLTAFGELAEGQNIPIQGPVIGTTKTYTLKRYGTGYRITAWMEKYNKFNQAQRLSRSLKKVMVESKDIEIHKMFNNPTTVLTGFDTLHLAEAAHTGLLDIGSDDHYDNLLSVAPSYTALASVRYYYTTVKNDVGMLMGMKPDLLVFEPTLWPTIQEILNSTKIAFEASNTESPWKGWIKPYEDPRLTSTTGWFTLATKDDNFDLNVFTGQEADFQMKDSPDSTRDRIATSECHFVYGFGMPKAYLCGNT